MKTLLLLRHAKSSWADPGVSDHDRPLNDRGKRDAPRVGMLIKELGIVPDLIVSSTAQRARKTASKVAKKCGFLGEITLTPTFYMAEHGDYIRYLQDVADDNRSVMVVGHCPTLEELLEVLTGELQSLPTAALVNIGLEITNWRELTVSTRGILMGIWRPNEFDD